MLCVKVYLAPQMGEFFDLRRMRTLTDVITMYVSESFGIVRKSVGVMWFLPLYEKNNPEILIEVLYSSDDVLNPTNDVLNPTREKIKDFSMSLLYEFRRSVAIPLEMYGEKIGIRFVTQSVTFCFEHSVGGNKEE